MRTNLLSSFNWPMGISWANQSTAQPNSTQATSPLSLENQNKLFQAFEQTNWLQARADIAQNQPNLSRVLAALDLVLPRQVNEQSDCLGVLVKAHHIQDTHCPQSLWVKGNLNSGNPQLDNLLQFEKNPEGEKASRAKDLNDGTVQLQRLEALHWLTGMLLNEQLDVATSLIQHNNTLDLSDQATKTLLNRVLPQTARPKKETTHGLSQQWYGQLVSALAPETDNNPPAAHLSSNEIHQSKQTALEIIELVSLLDWATLPASKSGPQLSEFPVYSENGLSDAIENLIENEYENETEDGVNPYLPTLISGLSRHIETVAEDAPFKATLDQSFWRYESNGQETTFHTKSEVICFLAELANQQLNSKNFDDAKAKGELLPLCVYEIMTRLTDQEIPQFISQAHQQLHETIRQNQAEKNAALARIAAAQQQRQEQKKQYAERTQKWIEEAEKLGVRANKQVVLIASSGSHPAIANKTFDIQIPLNAAQSIELNDLLQNETHFIWMDMAHNKRGYAAVERVKNSNDGFNAFFRDNQCWNRATWVSVFEQAESATQLAEQIDTCEIEIGSHVKQIVTGMYRGYITYERGRLAFLHQGEEDQMSTSPAHFRTGQTVDNFCAEFGLEPIQFPDLSKFFDKPVEHFIESQLRGCVPKLASGIRQTINELVSLESLGSSGMATSDIPVAVHRALGMTVVVVESGADNTLQSIRFAAPKGNPLEAEINNKPKNDEGIPVFQKGEISRIVKQTHVAVIHLKSQNANDGHFTVFLPINSVLGQQLDAARNPGKMLQPSKPKAIENKNTPKEHAAILANWHKQLTTQEALTLQTTNAIPKVASLAQPITTSSRNLQTKPAANDPSIKTNKKLISRQTKQNFHFKNNLLNRFLPTQAAKQLKPVSQPEPMDIDHLVKPMEIDAAQTNQAKTVQGEYQPIQFPGSEDLQLIATRETDLIDPLSVLRKAFEFSEKPLIFDFVSPRDVDQQTSDPLSELLAENYQNQIKVKQLKNPNRKQNNLERVFQIEIPSHLLGSEFIDGKNNARTFNLIEFNWPANNSEFNEADRKNRLELANRLLNQFTKDGNIPIIRSDSDEKPQTALSLLNVYLNNQNKQNIKFRDFYFQLFPSEHKPQNILLMNSSDSRNLMEITARITTG